MVISFCRCCSASDEKQIPRTPPTTYNNLYYKNVNTDNIVIHSPGNSYIFCPGHKQSWTQVVFFTFRDSPAIGQQTLPNGVYRVVNTCVINTASWVSCVAYCPGGTYITGGSCESLTMGVRGQVGSIGYDVKYQCGIEFATGQTELMSVAYCQ